MSKQTEKYLETWDDIEWSASRVTTAENCLYAFKKIYFDKENTDNYFAYRGSMMHNIMEDYYNYIHQYKIPLQSLRAHLVGVFEQLMEECPHEAVMYYRDKKGKTAKKSMNHNALSWSLMNWKPLSHIKHVEREIKFKVSKYKFRAFLDFEREYEKLSPSGGIEVITLHGDYKSTYSNKYRLQQYIYMYGKEQVDGKPPRGFEIIEYKNNFKSVVFEYDRGIIKFVKSDIVEAIQRAKKAVEEDDFPKNPKDSFFCMNLCKLCEYGR